MRIEFDPAESNQKRAVAASFDLSGFSTFCSQHDANLTLPRLIAALFSELNKLFRGNFSEFLAPTKSEDATQVVEPDFIKYSGDGALMLWFVSENPAERQRQSTIIVRILRQFYQEYPLHVKTWEEEWGVRGLPPAIRVGIAAGHVFELRRPPSEVQFSQVVDYAGYCLNLAIRLQNHCREVPFLIHELVNPKIDGILRAVARRMKGVMDEHVFAYSSDIAVVDEKILKPKFKAAE